MQSLWIRIGQISYWLGWPGIWLYLRRSRRTRLLMTYGDQVLVTKAWLGDGKWSLPGGGMHRNESPAVAVLRELHEETGLHVQAGKLKRVGSFTFINHGLTFPYELFTIRADKQLSLHAQRFEIVDARWVAMTSLDTHNAAPDVTAALSTLS